MFAPFKLRSAVRRDANADLDDTLRAKQALDRIGYFDTPAYGMTPYPDEPLFRGIEDFQRDNGLRRDGIMKPGGETAVALGRTVTCGGKSEERDYEHGLPLAAARCKPDDNDEKCYRRWDEERSRCGYWRPYGGDAVRGCRRRANARLRLCHRYGYPAPAHPKEWSEDDVLDR